MKTTEMDWETVNDTEIAPASSRSPYSGQQQQEFQALEGIHGSNAPDTESVHDSGGLWEHVSQDSVDKWKGG